MAKAVVLMAEGFEEIEFVTVVDVLRRCGIETKIAGLSIGAVEGAHGIIIKPDTSIDSISSKDVDALILPGGDPGYKNLAKDSRVINLAKKINEEGKLLSAICAAPTILYKNAIIKKGTCYPSMKDEFGKNWVNQRVYQTENQLTSQGPATAMEFALAIVEKLVEKAKTDEVASELLFKK
jgi:4-methyl-5(b-hydroxyethyl)-thiazole monophosphate biosynthesis